MCHDTWHNVIIQSSIFTMKRYFKYIFTVIFGAHLTICILCMECEIEDPNADGKETGFNTREVFLLGCCKSAQRGKQNKKSKRES